MSNRVWIYSSLKKFSDDVESKISDDLNSFLKSWSAHGIALSASFEMLHHHLIVIKADEDQAVASGCSIDKQVQFMKELGRKYDLDFFNRLILAYTKDGEFFICSSSQIKQLLENQILNENSLVFNLSVATEDEYRNNFLIPIKNTWLSRYLIQNSFQ
ncbi:MAG: hypothetical protein ACK5D5_00730 [Bacteroidota bacterium]|jgi:hypothetical protein